tara:strand:+ start:41304 stop:41585 length:282 start_codon:yes stop_codon:yes gene_type:complete
MIAMEEFGHHLIVEPLVETVVIADGFLRVGASSSAVATGKFQMLQRPLVGGQVQMSPPHWSADRAVAWAGPTNSQRRPLLQASDHDRHAIRQC